MLISKATPAKVYPYFAPYLYPFFEELPRSKLGKPITSLIIGKHIKTGTKLFLGAFPRRLL
jgi:hypothetical protein